ncbi:unnamed protein product [Sordaria macrospora k-hell]|uniref:WGS project CABT00000000 data, contig 2.6 n=1 Tax=Sordaria macrospora (strain ATCC MYA-333 / DSM 997 / K(L3346) / K-hell) TaxID=771870 RepID=F7VSX5_SORMK|nr:uncharacterized protein SMAC_05432 [Sordaria macrospora k-hell]CCC08792.1 unnamed protein product [Sordaria macrospora k-hell]
MSGVVESVQAKAQEVAKEDYDRAKTLINDAAKSGSYLYPVKGIFYFLSHRSLWKPLLKKLAPIVTLSVGVVTGMFFFTYVPQLALMTFVNGPLAVFTTAVLVLNESSAVISFLSRNFVMQDALLDTFDGTLVSRDATNLVSEGRELKSGRDPIQRLGKILKNPFQRFSPRHWFDISWVVDVIRKRCFIDWVNADDIHNSFGILATLLEMVPVASVFFSFTNAGKFHLGKLVGAALWAADIENKETEMTDGTAPGLREAAKKAE